MVTSFKSAAFSGVGDVGICEFTIEYNSAQQKSPVTVQFPFNSFGSRRLLDDLPCLFYDNLAASRTSRLNRHAQQFHDGQSDALTNDLGMSWLSLRISRRVLAQWHSHCNYSNRHSPSDECQMPRSVACLTRRVRSTLSNRVPLGAIRYFHSPSRSVNGFNSASKFFQRPHEDL